MRKFGQVIKLKPGKAGDYIKYHEAVWPDVLKTIKQCNISNYSIYIKDDWLFSYFEYIGKNYKSDLDKISQDKITRQWWDIVKPLMEPLETRQPGEFWAEMKEIFHLD